MFEEEKIEEIYEEILVAGRAPKKDGKGYAYPVTGHVSGMDGAARGDRKKLLAITGY